MKALLLDLDGTMYRGCRMMDGGRELMEALHQNHQRYLFLTNNSKRTRKQNVEHMENMGYIGIRKNDFFTSAMAAAIYVRKHYDKRKVFMIGEEGLREALLEQGFLFDDENPDFVFVGLDQKADYQKYSRAVHALKNGAILIGTNHDRVLAQENGFMLGNGSVVAMMEYAGNQKSPCIGKPYEPILSEALEAAQLSKDEVILVGDNLETDILLGVQNGVETVLVLGGVHTEADCERLGIYPDHIVSDLNELRVEFCLQKCH